jgi:hypothetical protein
MRSPILWKPWGVLDSKAYTTPVAVIASAAKIVAITIVFRIFSSAQYLSRFCFMRFLQLLEEADLDLQLFVWIHYLIHAPFKNNNTDELLRQIMIPEGQASGEPL